MNKDKYEKIKHLMPKAGKTFNSIESIELSFLCVLLYIIEGSA